MKTLLINLNKDVDRLGAMTQELSRIGLPFERVEGVFGTDLPDWLALSFREASALTPGEIGCYASHLKAMRQIAASNEPGLILEDDLAFADDTLEILASISKLPRNWDMLKLSGSDNRTTATIGTLTSNRKIIKYASLPWGAGAYIITPRGAKKFLNWKTPRTAPVDLDFRRAWDHGLNIYGLSPIPVRQNIGSSSIATLGVPPLGRSYRGYGTFGDRFKRALHCIMWLGLVKGGRSLLPKAMFQ